jgi:glycogen debranching enzyme
MATVLVRAGLQYAWRGPSLLVVADEGTADVKRDALHGFYYREARFLSRLALAINGHRPWLCECAAVAPDRLAFTYVHPEIVSPGGGGTGQSDDGEHLGMDGLPERALEIQCEYQLHLTHLRVLVTVTNRSRREVKATVTYALDADFADLLEAQSGHREQTATVAADVTPSRLAFVYQHPKLPYRTDIHPTDGWRVEHHQLTANIALTPQQSHSLEFDVVPHIEGERVSPEDAQARERAVDQWLHAFTRLEVPGNRLAEQVLASNARDIASLPSLQGQPDEWLAMHAGMPLYPAFFGRDAVTAGWQAAMLDRGSMLDAALTRLGRVQASTDDPWADAEPGRIPYQMRSGPLARLGLNP